MARASDTPTTNTSAATRPDVTYPRDKVDVACAACHKQHDVPATKVIGRFLERKLPARPAVICTDCHGSHRIERAGSPPSEQCAAAAKRGNVHALKTRASASSPSWPRGSNRGSSA